MSTLRLVACRALWIVAISTTGHAGDILGPVPSSGLSAVGWVDASAAWQYFIAS